MFVDVIQIQNTCTTVKCFNIYLLRNTRNRISLVIKQTLKTIFYQLQQESNTIEYIFV